MRVIVTGGTGFIGQKLIRSLTADGHEVIILSRNPQPSSPTPDRVSVRRWDARTAEGWGDAADGADAIVNLAGSSIAGEHFLPSRWTDEQKRLIRESRTHAGQAVVEAVKAASNKPRVVIQSSAAGYYGTHGDELITEDSPAGNDFLADVCKEWEASTAPVEDEGVRRVIARTSPVLSFEHGALQRLSLPFRLFVGGPMGSGKQYFPWIHPDDLVGAIRFLIDHADASGAFNVCSPNPLTNAEFGRVLGRVLGRPSLIPVPGIVFRLAFGEVAMVVLEGQRTVPKRLLDAGYTFKFPDAEAALRDLYSKESRILA